jgi:hypothetical protein
VSAATASSAKHRAPVAVVARQLGLAYA